MKIADLKDGTGKVNITAKVIEKGPVREVNTKNGRLKVSDAVIEDDSGTITLTLWGDEGDKIKQGDEVKIENGFVKEWNNSLQLSAGKYGKLVVL